MFTECLDYRHIGFQSVFGIVGYRHFVNVLSAPLLDLVAAHAAAALALIFTKTKPIKYSPEVMERAVRIVLESREQYESQWAAIQSIAGKIGCTAETLQRWVRQHERDTGQRPGTSTAEQQRVKELGREVRELRKTNEIMRLPHAE